MKKPITKSRRLTVRLSAERRALVVKCAREKHRNNMCAALEEMIDVYAGAAPSHVITTNLAPPESVEMFAAAAEHLIEALADVRARINAPLPIDTEPELAAQVRAWRSQSRICLEEFVRMAGEARTIIRAFSALERANVVELKNAAGDWVARVADLARAAGALQTESERKSAATARRCLPIWQHLYAVGLVHHVPVTMTSLTPPATAPSPSPVPSNSVSGAPSNKG